MRGVPQRESGAEAPRVAFAGGKGVPKRVSRFLVFSLHHSWAKGGFYPPAAMQPCLSWSRDLLLQRTGNLSPPFKTVRVIRLAEYHRAALFILDVSWATRANSQLAGFLNFAFAEDLPLPIA